MKVIKRDGHMVEYSPEKIENAILKANKDVSDAEKASPVQIKNIIKYIEGLGKKRILVEDIQDIIEIKLMSIGKFTLAKKYITYRYTRELVRKSNTTDVAIKKIISDNNENRFNQSSGINTKLVAVQRDYLAGITSTDIARRFLLPEDIVRAHDDGILYFHDMEYFAQNALYNSSIINLEDMLKNGCNINGIKIDKPRDFKEAINITIQIVGSVMSCQYGKITISLSHLAPFVVDSYKKYLKKHQKRNTDNTLISEYATEDLKEEITYGIKRLIYEINTMTICSNSLVNLFMYLGESKQYKQETSLLIEEVLKQNIDGIKDEEDNPIKSLNLRPIYVIEEDNIQEDSKYYYLTKLVIDCIAKDINLGLISEKIMLQSNTNEKYFACIDECMFLSSHKDGKPKSYGRFNQGIVTINLLDIALASDKDIDLFWNLFEERLELCHRALQTRHKRLSNITSDSSPILWRYGAISRLGQNENIHDLLHDNYSTLSLGFMGLYECSKFMKGFDFYETDTCESFTLKILEKMNSKCKRWSDTENIAYTLYWTSDKSASKQFAGCLKERFGLIKGITDKEYLIDSHFIVSSGDEELYQKINTLHKIQKLINGGHRIYLGIDGNNKKTKVKEVLNHIYENVLYVQVNSKIDTCLQCKNIETLQLKEGVNWQCASCKNDSKKLYEMGKEQL